VWYIDTSTTPDNLYYWNGSVWTLTGDGTGSTSSALLTQDEGAALGSATTMNFAGAGVVATHSSGITTVTIPGGSGTFATNAEAQAGTSAALLINPANLYARESIAAQTGLANNPASIAAPTAGQSPFGTTILGEAVRYFPGIGWKVVGANYAERTNYTADVSASGGTVIRGTFTCHRAGAVYVSMGVYGISNGSNQSVVLARVSVNGDANSLENDSCYDATSGNAITANVSRVYVVTAGQVISFTSYHNLTLSGLLFVGSSAAYVN
jgi:hypothetical protein